MQLATTNQCGTLVISVREGRIDAASAIQFKDAMRKATQAAQGRVVLDMSEVQFVDSSGLGAIVAAMKQLGDRRKLALSGLTPDVDRVFRLTRMDSVFGIYPSVDAALGLRASG